MTRNPESIEQIGPSLVWLDSGPCVKICVAVGPLCVGCGRLLRELKFHKALPMTESEYLQFCKALFQDEPHDDLCSSAVTHATIGVAGEVCEVLSQLHDQGVTGDNIDSVHMMEELGDLEFYLAVLHDSLGILPEETHCFYSSPAHSMLNVTEIVGDMLDLLKRGRYYGNAQSKDSWVSVLLCLRQWMKFLYDTFEITRENAIAANVRKLRARYPDGFDNQDSVNRNKEAERKALEGNE